MTSNNLQFNLTNLVELDNGKATAAINHALRQIVDDIQERPGDKAKRKVILNIEMVPILDKTTAVLDTVGVQIRIDTKVPIRQTMTYPMLATADNTLRFVPQSPLDPRQTAFDFSEDEAPVTEEDAEPGDEVTEI
jgi:hypothetical protein